MVLPRFSTAAVLVPGPSLDVGDIHTGQAVGALLYVQAQLLGDVCDELRFVLARNASFGLKAAQRYKIARFEDVIVCLRGFANEMNRVTSRFVLVLLSALDLVGSQLHPTRI